MAAEAMSRALWASHGSCQLCGHCWVNDSELGSMGSPRAGMPSSRRAQKDASPQTHVELHTSQKPKEGNARNL